MTSSQKLSLGNFAQDETSQLPVYDLIGTGLVPEPIIRAGIRFLLRQKLRELSCSAEEATRRLESFAEELRRMPLAVETDAANRQHYEVPAEFFKLVLGPHMKYSCALWESGDSLENAERRMLSISCERAEIEDGQTILELGCGWGSLTLFMAQNYPNSTVVAMSNSASQRRYIERQAAERGLKNIEIITCNVTEFDTTKRFDRIVSVEMFEHLKNYAIAFKRVAEWLKPDGKFFCHVFTHRSYPYHFVGDKHDWLTRYFFSGGTMPSSELFSQFRDDLRTENHWQVSGMHYKLTADAWLERMQTNRDELKRIIGTIYGPTQSRRWFMYWKVFFLACSELWGFDNGTEWMVGHYRMIRVKT